MTMEFEDYKRRRVEGSILSFIRGKKNLAWVIGIIKGKWGVRDRDLNEILDKIPYRYINYDSVLLEQLKQKCLEEGIIRKK